MSDDSWDKLPQAKVRVLNGDLKPLLDGLGPDGFRVTYRNKVQMLEDGIYIELETNVGEYPNIVPYPIEVFIPIEAKKMPKVKNEDQTEDEKPTTNPTTSTSTTGDITMVSGGDPTEPTGLGDRSGVGLGGPETTNGLQSGIGDDGVVVEGSL